jgi:hypothetical protein
MSAETGDQLRTTDKTRERRAGAGIRNSRKNPARADRHRAESADNTAYTFMSLALKYAGVDPKDVNVADPMKACLDDKSDALFVAATGAVAFHANPANKAIC